jgi:hypothetical protein
MKLLPKLVEILLPDVVNNRLDGLDEKVVFVVLYAIRNSFVSGDQEIDWGPVAVVDVPVKEICPITGEILFVIQLTAS